MNISVKQQCSKTGHPLTLWQTHREDWRTWLVGSIGLIIWIGSLCTLLYQFANFILVPIGDYYDAPFLKGAFSERETSAVNERGFRWTTGSAELYIPGIGRGSKIATVNILSQHPDGQAVDTIFHLASNEMINVPDAVETRTIHTFIPANATNDGDFSLRIASNLYNESTASARNLGVALFGFSVASTHSSAWLPPLSSVVLLSLLGLGAALTLRLTGLATLWAYFVAALLTTAIAGLLLVERVPTVLWLPNLAALAWGSLLLIVLVRRAVTWLCIKGGVELGKRERTLLLLLFTFGFWLKAGGQLYPYMIAIDLHWHMDRVRWILDGRLAEMYRPGEFNESVMPVKEWGVNRPTIPYSPFFHIFATSFSLFPWQLETTAKIFNALIDTSRVFIVYYLARVVGARQRGSLLAAALYMVLPATFLLQSWGNAPTAFGMWWTLVSSAFIIGMWSRLRELKIFSILAIILVITFLIYTVMAVYMGMLLVIWLLLVASRQQDQRPQVWAVTSATMIALALSLLIYYGQYIPEIVQKTVPYFGRTLTQGQGSVGATPFEESYSHYLISYLPRLWHYGLLVPLILAPLGIWLLKSQNIQPSKHVQVGLWWIVSMLVVSLIFVPIARSVPMVDKNVFFSMPVLAILGGVLADHALIRIRWFIPIVGAWYSALVLERLTAPVPIDSMLWWLLFLLPVVLVGVVSIATLRFQRRWVALPLILIYFILLFAALDLWIYRIEAVKQVW